MTLRKYLLKCIYKCDIDTNRDACLPINVHVQPIWNYDL